MPSRTAAAPRSRVLQQISVTGQPKDPCKHRARSVLHRRRISQGTQGTEQHTNHPERLKVNPVPLRPLSRWAALPAEHTSTALPGTGNIHCSKDWKVLAFPAARKVTGLISFVQGCGTADNCLARGSPSSTAQCCRRKVKEGDQMVSSSDSYKTPCRLCHTAALSPNKQLSHTATPSDSGSWGILLLQLLESILQSPGPGEGVCWMLQAQQALLPRYL